MTSRYTASSTHTLKESGPSPRHHPGCSDHALLDCYRCPTGVVAIANALIGHNMDREPLQLTPVLTNGAGEMWIVQYPDVAREAQAIATFVDDQINKQGRQPGEILILAQRRTIGNPIHAALACASRGAASPLLCGDYPCEGSSELEPAGQLVADREPDHDARGFDAIRNTACGGQLWRRIPAFKPLYS